MTVARCFAVACLLGVSFPPTVEGSAGKSALIKIRAESELTDYQIRLKIGWTPGMAQDFRDIRFTEDGRQVHHWIERYLKSVSATVWIKVPSIRPGSDNLVRLHYGDPHAEDSSDAGKVFEFLDDFEKPMPWKVVEDLRAGTIEVGRDEARSYRTKAERFQINVHPYEGGYYYRMCAPDPNLRRTDGEACAERRVNLPVGSYALEAVVRVDAHPYANAGGGKYAEIQYYDGRVWRALFHQPITKDRVYDWTAISLKVEGPIRGIRLCFYQTNSGAPRFIFFDRLWIRKASAVEPTCQVEGLAPQTARAVAADEGIVVTGKGNTLSSISEDVGNAKLFAYDPISRTAISRVSLFLYEGGELALENAALHFKGEGLCLRTNCNGRVLGDGGATLRLQAAKITGGSLVIEAGTQLTASGCQLGPVILKGHGCSIEECRLASLSLKGTRDSRILGCRVNAGMTLAQSDRNTFLENETGAIALERSNYNIFSRNSINGRFRLYTCMRNVITHNTFAAAGEVIAVPTPGSSKQPKAYADHTVRGNTVFGEPLLYVFDNRNPATGKREDPFVVEDKRLGYLLVIESRNVRLRKITSEIGGIYVQECRDGRIEDCRIAVGNSSAICLDMCEGDCRISRCELTSSAYNVPTLWLDSARARIDRCRVNAIGRARWGIRTYTLGGSLVSNCTVRSASSGIECYQSGNNRITSSVIQAAGPSLSFGPARYAPYPLRVLNTLADYNKTAIRASMIVYWFMDVRVVDQQGVPIEGAEVTVKCERPDPVVTRDAKGREQKFYLVTNLDEQRKARFLTGRDGHTPLPSQKSATIVVADYYEKSLGEGSNIVSFTYTVTASKGALWGQVQGVDPNPAWYRADPATPSHTVTVVVKPRLGARMERRKSEDPIRERWYGRPVEPCEWKNIGKYSCYGVPDVSQDPNNPDNYIITWQRYASRAGRTVEDVKFAIYNAEARTFSREMYAFDPRNMTIMQGHPCWGYSHGKYRIFYCQGKHIAEVTAKRWSDFQEYLVSNNERVITPDLGGRPFAEFLAVDERTAWLFYLDWWDEDSDSLSYTVYRLDRGWSGVEHPMPTSKVVGDGQFVLGDALTAGDDIVLYSSVCSGSKYAGKAYRFKTGDRGQTWTVDEVVVSGITAPFKRSEDGQLRVRVVRKGDWYYMSSQSDDSHRWLARGNDGVHFEVIADFGSRRSLGNAMANIRGTSQILLVYADYPDPNPRTTVAPGVPKNIECLVYDVGECDR